MDRTLIGLGLTLALAFLSGAAHSDSRNKLDEFWNLSANDPANGPIELFNDPDDDGLADTLVWTNTGDGEPYGDDDDDDGLPDTITWTNVGDGYAVGDDDYDDGVPDIIIWCLDGDGTSTDVVDPTDERLLLFTDRNAIFDAAGKLQCTAQREGRMFQLRKGVDGPVLFTATLGRYVFDGEVARLPVRSTKAWRKLVRQKTAFEFYGPKIYDGSRRFGDVEISASESVSRANPMRKLLISALLSGACGADGYVERR